MNQQVTLSRSGEKTGESKISQQAVPSVDPMSAEKAARLARIKAAMQTSARERRRAAVRHQFS
ncbi:hypothetical protein [Pelagicoccus albus]|uniref:Uncharacterized protein n=1 Tax=Pelagicoccus albus TaxID=415222 RepID=A0A7X1B3G4_9BACT|nr:hypothetical protein [Pelagicoccus albus]MBC2604949.1 hypothetical protein [Pelagicoccus albus]